MLREARAGFWALGPLLAFLLLLLVYQFPRPIVLDLGTTYARPYLEGFFEPETAPIPSLPYSTRGDRGPRPGPGPLRYAYTSARSHICLPGIGHGPALLLLRMGGGVPGVRQNLSAGGQPLGEVMAGEFATYAYLLPTEAIGPGGVILTWQGETHSPPHDPRQLGIAVAHLLWLPLAGPVWPDWEQVFWVALAALSLYFLARRLDLSPAGSAFLSVLLVVFISLGIALAHLYLTIYTPRLAGLLLALALLLPLLRRATRSLLRRIGMEMPVGVERAFWRISTLAALIKLGGTLYPQMIVLDALPHAYRVYRFLAGETDSLFLPGYYSHLGWTVGLEGGQFPYSPLFYLLSVPLTLLPIPLTLSMGLLAGVLDVARNLLLYLLGNKVTGHPRAGLWTAFFYTVLPAPYYLLSWGNYPTQLGLFAALLTLTFLALNGERLSRRGTFLGWLGVLVFALLSYTVVGAMTVVLLLLFLPLEVVFSSARGRGRRWGAVLGGLLLAEGIIFLLYHSNFVASLWQETLPAIVQAVTNKAASPVPPEVDPRLGLLSNWVANWIFARNHLTEMGVLWAALGLLGLLGEPSYRRWRPLLLAWLLIFPLLALFSGLVADLVLKHIFFLFPLFCLGAGVLADTLWRRKTPAGQAVVFLFSCLLAGISLLRWLEYILVKRHG